MTTYHSASVRPAEWGRVKLPVTGLSAPPNHDGSFNRVAEMTQEDISDDMKGMTYRLDVLKLRLLAIIMSGQLVGEGDRNSREQHGQQQASLASARVVNEITKFKPLYEANNALLAVNSILSPEHRATTEGQSNCESLVGASYKLLSGILEGARASLDEREEAEALLARAVAIQKSITQARLEPELGLFSQGESGQQGITDNTLPIARQDYRELLKSYSLLLEHGSWFSPTYGASIEPQRGPNQQRIFPLRNDYQRWQMSERENLQKRIGGLLANNGMNALSLILDYLESKDPRLPVETQRRAFYQMESIYFEVDHVLEEHCAKNGRALYRFNPSDLESLCRKIGEHWPAAIFVAPAQAACEQRVFDIVALVEALAKLDSSKRKQITVVIDNTLMGPFAQWLRAGDLKLPVFVSILSFESLIKYGQDGQELCQAGIIRTNPYSDQHDLERFMQRRGYTASEGTVRRVDAVYMPEIVESRLQRHSRNTDLMAQALRESAKIPNSIISWVGSFGDPEHPDYSQRGRIAAGSGGLFSIAFDFRMLCCRGYCRYDQTPSKTDIVENFINLVTKLAQRQGLSLHHGSSYGFNVTRIASYHARWSQRLFPISDDELNENPRETNEVRFRDLPYLRIAPGIENARDAVAIARCFARANEMFAEAIRHGRPLRF